MKITITVPTKELTKLAATAALASGNTLPENFQEVVDQTPEVDITEILKSDNEAKVAIQGMTFVALQAILDKCEES
jgi:hypothetical protein|nr:MAG TPA: hypothetical protein [Caudoviricetes sp.]